MQVLALDVGSSSTRACAYDERGAEAGAAAQRKYEARRARDGSAELDPDELVSAARAVLDEVEGGHDAIGISCFMHSLLLLDERERPLTPALLWQDRRAAAEADELARRLDQQAVHARTGCVFHPSFWPAKLAWLQAEQPETFARARRLVSLADYLFLQLTGELRTTLSAASGTGLLDLRRRSWDAALLDELGVAAELMPPLDAEPVETTYPPVADGACSNLGSGCTTRERAALMIGTSGALRVLHEGEPEPRPGLFCYLLDERRVFEGGAVSDGGNLYAWLERTLRLDGGELGPPDGHGLTFLPLLGGERSPGWNSRARGAIAGLTFDAGPGDLLQAAFEGIAYRIAESAQALPEVREVVATGHGLLENTGWIQIFADVLGRPVTASDVAEGSARGAAAHVLERLGVTAEPAPLGRTYEPDAERHEVYAAARERQRELYERLF
ncbi:MAG TPA: gluconokinase [Gaiellaceae bacterium]|nr:gluconokinase [Gaiellaceae bacterium]